jgi:hypothetical protein
MAKSAETLLSETLDILKRCGYRRVVDKVLDKKGKRSAETLLNEAESYLRKVPADEVAEAKAEMLDEKESNTQWLADVDRGVEQRRKINRQNGRDDNGPSFMESQMGFGSGEERDEKYYQESLTKSFRAIGFTEAEARLAAGCEDSKIQEALRESGVTEKVRLSNSNELYDLVMNGIERGE